MTTNTLTGLIPSVYSAIDVVSRELTGMIPAVTVDARASAAALNQVVAVPIVPTSNSITDNTPAMSVPSEADQTIGNVEVKITKSKHVPFSWSGEEELGLNNGGPGAMSIQQNQIVQAIRTLTNSMEADLTALRVNASRAAGTVTTTPFASTVEGAMNARRILVDNGAGGDFQIVCDTAAGAKLRTLGGLQAGRDAVNMTEQGILYRAGDVTLRESAQISSAPTVGTMASATSTNAAFTVGQTTIPLATAGTGTVVAGDVITFANDTNQYVVASATFAGANPASGDSIVLAAPGLRVAQGAATRAITVVATGPRNMAFSRSAIVLATRAPTRPKQGDLAIDVEYITDPRTGLTFELAVYPGFRKVVYHIGIAWGVKSIKDEHIALLLG